VRVEKEISNLDTVVKEIVYIIKELFSLFTYSVILFALAPVLAFGYIILGYIYTIPTRRFRKESFQLDYSSTEERRRARVSLASIRTQNRLPDIMVLGLTGFLKNKFNKFFFGYYIPKYIRIYYL